MANNIKFVITWGAYDARFPRPPSRLGRGMPPPHSTLEAPRFSGPLNTKSWLRQWPLVGGNDSRHQQNDIMMLI